MPFRLRTCLARLIASVLSGVLRLVRRTWRLDVDGLDNLEEHLAQGRRALLVFWHGKYIPILTILDRQPSLTFTSPSFRGEVIRLICQRFGHECHLLLPFSEEKNRDDIRGVIDRHRLVGIAADGPLGPYHRVKRGVVLLARDFDMTVFPVSMTARHRIVLRRRWDRMELPLPYSRVRMLIDQPVAFGMQPGELSVGSRKKLVRDAIEEASVKLSCFGPASFSGQV